jgi:hypothetical protein
VTGRIADGEKDRFVVGSRLRERVVAPRKPVDRVFGVLKKVRAALVPEAVHQAIMTVMTRQPSGALVIG